ATVALSLCARVEHNIAADKGARSILLGPLALVIAPDEDLAAAQLAGSVEARIPDQCNLVAQDIDRAALAAAARVESAVGVDGVAAQADDAIHIRDAARFDD